MKKQSYVSISMEEPMKEKLRYLRRQRQKLLADIHSKQKSLDQLDYIIFDTNKETGPADQQGKDFHGMHGGGHLRNQGV